MFGSNGQRKKEEGLIEINQNQGFLSPHGESAEQTIGVFLRQKFARLHHRQKEQIIKNVFHNLYGRHNAIEYKESYNFQERWEQLSKPTYYESKYSLIKTENLMPTFIQIVLLIFYVGITWFLTIYRLFDTNNLVKIFVPLIIATQVKDVCLKVYFIKKAINQEHYGKAGLAWLDHLTLHWSNLIFLPYCIFLIIQNLENPEDKSIYFIFIDFFFIWRTYLRLNEIYDGIKIRIMASKIRNQLQVIQLLTRCIYIVHFFGIILYFVSRVNPNLNWSLSIANFEEAWITRYVYSLYFASTTLTTVGYGDITPKNMIEIITILFIQIFGIINFGYIVNEIGRILSKINEKQQILTKNISQAENIAQTYKIPEALALQMRNYIINNQIAHDQLNVEEQDNFMRKLNDEIRQGFNSLNQIRVIKSSVFFLCHWSKKFQRKIASKLIRSIYAPQQSLIQTQGKEKLYILSKGKIDVIACLVDHSILISMRPLKVIEINPHQEVHFNVYGYSSLISGLQINLKAIVKDYSICYTLSKQDFLNAIIEDQRDFQYYHEIKAKIEQSYFKEIWEAPKIMNTREHYLPNPYCVLLKNRQIVKKQQLKRKVVLRKFKKSKCYIQAEVQVSSQQIMSESSQAKTSRQQNILQKIMRQPSIRPDNQVLNAKQRKMKYDNILNLNNPCLIKNRSYSQRRGKKIEVFENEQQKKKHEEQIQKLAILNDFQEKSKFQAYFPKANWSKMMERYQKIYHKNIYHDLRYQKSQKLQTMNHIPLSVLEKLINIKVFGSQNLD